MEGVSHLVGNDRHRFETGPPSREKRRDRFGRRISPAPIASWPVRLRLRADMTGSGSIPQNEPSPQCCCSTGAHRPNAKVGGQGFWRIRAPAPPSSTSNTLRVNPGIGQAAPDSVATSVISHFMILEKVQFARERSAQCSNCSWVMPGTIASVVMRDPLIAG